MAPFGPPLKLKWRFKRRLKPRQSLAFAVGPLAGGDVRRVEPESGEVSKSNGRIGHTSTRRNSQ